MKYFNNVFGARLPIVLTVCTNLVLLLLYAGFIRFRCTNLIHLLHQFNEPLNVAIFFKSLGHELIVFLIGMLSLVGILLKRNSTLFFFTTLLYISITSTTIILAPSISIVYFIKLLTTLTFLTVIIFKNVFLVYQHKIGLKFVFLLLGMIMYSVILYFVSVN